MISQLKTSVPVVDVRSSVGALPSSVYRVRVWDRYLNWFLYIHCVNLVKLLAVSATYNRSLCTISEHCGYSTSGESPEAR